MGYSGVFVFGDSLVDAGNALKLAEWYGDLTFSDLPDGAPTAELGYFQGRFSNGYTFADLLANKTIGTVTKPVFPYGYEDPWLGIPVAPWASDPSGNNLNFAYGGAQIRQGDEAVPDLDGQTDAFRDAVDGDADPNALYLVTMGGNDVRNLAPSGGDPVAQADGYAALDKAAEKYLTELSQLVAIGAKHIIITGVPDVGLIPRYDRDGNLVLDSAEQQRADAATDFSVYLDTLIRTEVVPALQALGATVTYVPLMDYTDASGNLVTGALNANLATIAALHGLTADELSGNLLQYQNLVFFDQIHPNAQANALLGAYMHAQLTGTPWVETLPLTSAEVDYRMSASISVAGEVDKLVVSLVAGTTYTLDMLGVSSLGTAGSLADPSLRLLGPNGSVFGSNADDGAGFDSTLTFTAATTGNYTIELFGTGTPTGTYVLQAAVIGGAATLAGNSYTINNAATVVLEGAGGVGQDVVKASVSYALSEFSEIEVLRTTNDKGKTAINLTGNEFGQTIVGNAGSNVLEGKAGADVLTGGAGKDVFVLSNAAVTNPGPASIDTITDYALGDVVDITQILNVGAGVDVTAGGYLRVTTGGFIQVDLDGGGDQWVTLSSINGSAAVTVRYLSGGSVASISAPRVAATQTSAVSTSATTTMLAGAVAAAGLMAEPLAAATAAETHASAASGSNRLTSSGIDMTVALDGAEGRLARAGETRLLAEHDTVAPTIASATLRAVQSLNADLLAAHSASADSLTELLKGTDAPAHGGFAAFESPVANAVAMPSAEMLQPLTQASAAHSVMGSRDGLAIFEAVDPSGEVSRILADALGSGGNHALDALLDALPGRAHELGVLPDAVASHFAANLASWWDAPFTGFDAEHGNFAMDTLGMHQDAMPPA